MQLIATPVLLIVGMVALSVMHAQPEAADFGPVAISSVNPVGLQSDGRYHVTLKGKFNTPADVRPLVLCDGKPWPAAVHSATTSSLDISMPPHRHQPRCVFLAYRLTDGVYSVPSAALTNAGQDVIGGAIDRGLIDLRHGMEFYGSFPRWQTLSFSVACTQGGDVNPTITPYDPAPSIEGRSATQINLTFADIPNVGARCSFTPIDGAGIATGPLWGPTPLSPHDLYRGTAGFGFYHGNTPVAVGADADDALESGQRWLSRAGFNVTKIHISPDHRTGRWPGRNGNNPYHFNLDMLANECPILPPSQNPTGNASPPYLPCAARSTAYQKLFNAPYLHTIVMTAYDSASMGDYGVLDYRRNPDWWKTPGNTEKVIAEYRDFALALYETQHATGKLFIISNWETDSELQACYDNKPCNVDAFADALRRWFSARKQGILQARMIAQARGLGGVTVSDAIEFQDPPSGVIPRPKTIDAIIPSVMPEYLSWSAWGGTGANRGGRIDQDVYDLKRMFPNNSPQLFFGELGREFAKGPGSSWDDFEGRNHGFIVAAHARAAQRANVPATILWTGYDDAAGQTDAEGQPIPPNLHFFDSNGAERSIVQRIRDALSAGQQELQAGVTARIGGIRVSTYWDPVTSQEVDYFEMYIDPQYGQGQWPATIDKADVVVQCSYTCTGSGTTCQNPTPDSREPVIHFSRGPNQSNLAIRHRDAFVSNGRMHERWCTVKVPGVLMHGPKAVSPTPEQQ
jgi:hypothetical protein